MPLAIDIGAASDSSLRIPGTPGQKRYVANSHHVNRWPQFHL